MISPRLKRIGLILGVIILGVGVFVAAWFLFFQPFVTVTRPTNGNTNTATGTLPNVNSAGPTNGNTNNPIARGPSTLPTPSDVANGDLTLVSDVSSTPVTAPVIGPDGKSILFYSDLDDRFLRLDPATGTLVDLTSQKFPDVKKITWAPDGERAVLEFPDDRKVIYDFSNRRQYTLPTQAQDFSFSTDSDQLAYEYVGTGPDESFLVTAKADGSGSTAVAKLADKTANVQVAWSPSKEVVGFFRQSANASQQEIVLIGQHQENFKTITTDGKGFQGKWTPDGSKVLYTVYSEATNWNPELHLVFARGNETGRGNVNLGLQTSIEKCVFNRSGTHAYCAVPDLLERGSGLYPEFSANAKDAVYTINLNSGAVSPIALPVTGSLERFSIDRLVLSPDETVLYFTDRGTGKLVKIRLK
ncbi:MAG: PD40 domain-containing protein [Candidatus Kerfeldbacteria bacterium]|nr:PD40 domain-containing protein [Candidatus Kerfeldbacteria bacterium]